MNILAAIIVNLVILGVLTIGFFVGKGNRVWLQTLKFICYAGVSVGLFFLTPIVVNLLPPVESLPVEGLVDVFYFVVYAFMFLIAYLIIWGAFIPLKRKVTKSKRVSKNKNKVILKGKSSDDNVLVAERNKRALRNQRYKLTAEYNQKYKGSRIMGGIFGVLSAFLILVVMALPAKFMLNSWYNSYDHSLIGFLDNTFKGSETLIDEWTKDLDENEPEEVEYNFEYTTTETFDLSKLDIVIEVESEVGTGEFVIDQETGEPTDQEIMETVVNEVTLSPISYVATYEDETEVNLEEAFNKVGIITIVATYEYNDETFERTFTIKVTEIEVEDEEEIDEGIDQEEEELPEEIEELPEEIEELPEEIEE